MAKMNEQDIDIEQGISTVLAPDIDFNGTLKFKTSLMIKGKLTGNIDAQGHLVVGPNAVVDASVKAARITNYGTIKGELEAGELLEMKKGAVQTGNIKVADLTIESGCKVNGTIEMTAGSDTKKV
mgnify:CR=1 FL=1